MKKTPKRELIFVDKIIKYAIMGASAIFVSMAIAYDVCGFSNNHANNLDNSIAAKMLEL